MNSTNRRAFVRYITFFLVVFFTAAILSSFLLYFTNSLRENGRWIHFREVREYSYNFDSSIASLLHNRLNLSIYGNSYVTNILFYKKLAIREITFNFSLEKKGYFYFIFNCDGDTFCGLRISKSKIVPSAFIRGMRSGRFTYTDNVDLSNNLQKNNTCRLQYVGNKLNLYINNELIYAQEAVIFKKQTFGFVGSLSPAYVDDVSVKTADGSTISETFSRSKDFPYVFLAIVLLFMFGVISMWCILHMLNNDREILVKVMIMMFSVSFTCVVCFIIFCINKNLLHRVEKSIVKLNNSIDKYSNTIYENVISDNDADEIFEPSRKYIFSPEEIEISKQYWDSDRNAKNRIQDVMSRYYDNNSNNGFRILFIGTSQTWGEGAATRKGTFVALLQETFNQKLSKKYECINAGIGGSDAQHQLWYFKRYWLLLRPDMVCLNLSNNDFERDLSNQDFIAVLEEFITLSKEYSLKLVFIVEPNSKERDNGSNRLQKAMKRVGLNKNIVVIDPHQYLAARHDKGIIWWDYVHLTPYGHRLFAEYLAKKIPLP